jgi:hypothetical protein
MENKTACIRTIAIMALLFFSRPAMAELVLYGEGYVPLDKDAFAYVLTDIKKMRPLFDIVPVSQLKTRQAALIIDNTEMALAAFFPLATGRFFQIVGFGTYPNLPATVALAINRNWRYMFSDRENYWYSNADRLSVRIGPNEINAVSWRRMQVSPVPEEPGVKMPEGFIAFRHRRGEAAPLSLWLENRDAIITRMFNGEGLPVLFPLERLYLKLYQTEGNKYWADVLLQSRSFFFLEELWKDASRAETDSVLKALFFAEQPVQNGRNLEFQSAQLSEEELAAFITLFIKNWR